MGLDQGAYCHGCGSTMIVTIVRDAYGSSGTILVSLEGSPPKAYAILYSGGVGFFDPDNDDEVTIGGIMLLSCCLEKHRLLRGSFTVSLNELKQRKDIILTIAKGAN